VFVVETITVAATRSSEFSLSEMEMLVGSAIVIAVLVWMLLSRVRRDRNQPHA
jgi:ABC-type nickel/cobalt efflux system permease component RcnA